MKIRAVALTAFAISVFSLLVSGCYSGYLQDAGDFDDDGELAEGGDGEDESEEGDSTATSPDYTNTSTADGDQGSTGQTWPTGGATDDPDCDPVRIIQDGSNLVEPGRTISIRADLLDSRARVVDSLWRLTAKPDASNAQPLKIDGDNAAVQILPDFLGLYRVSVVLQDDGGTFHGPCEYKFYCDFDSLVAVELTWTAAGSSPTGDADLDLHVKASPGNWGGPPDDCFWDNPRAEWGDTSNPDDNGVVVDDSTRAPGPEHFKLVQAPLNLENLEVGVYGGDGSAADVRLKIFMRGVKVGDFNRFGLSKGEFWRVARVGLNSSTVESMDTVTQGFPQ